MVNLCWHPFYYIQIYFLKAANSNLQPIHTYPKKDIMWKLCPKLYTSVLNTEYFECIRVQSLFTRRSSVLIFQKMCNDGHFTPSTTAILVKSWRYCNDYFNDVSMLALLSTNKLANMLLVLVAHVNQALMLLRAFALWVLFLISALHLLTEDVIWDTVLESTAIIITYNNIFWHVSCRQILLFKIIHTNRLMQTIYL